MLWTLLWPAAINTIVGRYPAIDRCLLELVLSTDGDRPVVYIPCITDCHGASLFTAQKATHQWIRRRREHNLIYAAVNLTLEYNRRLRLTFCTIEANYWQTRSIARPHCNSRASCLDHALRPPPNCYIISNSQSWAGRPLLYHSFTSCRPTHSPAYQISTPT